MATNVSNEDAGHFQGCWTFDILSRAQSRQKLTPFHAIIFIDTPQICLSSIFLRFHKKAFLKFSEHKNKFKFK